MGSVPAVQNAQQGHVPYYSESNKKQNCIKPNNTNKAKHTYTCSTNRVFINPIFIHSIRKIFDQNNNTKQANQ